MIDTVLINLCEKETRRAADGDQPFQAGAKERSDHSSGLPLLWIYSLEREEGDRGGMIETCPLSESKVDREC